MEWIEIALTAVSLIGAVVSTLTMLIVARIGRAEDKVDRSEDRHADTARVAATLEALLQERGVGARKVEDRTSAHGETLAGLSSRLAAVERMSHECDELKAKVAVLQDWKDRNVSKIDQAVADIAAMQRDIKTLFERSKSLPGDVVNELMARLRPRMADRT